MNTNKKSLIFLAAIAIVCLMTSCAQIYKSPDAYIQANKHQLVAIVPPKVSIFTRKRIVPEAIKHQEQAESINFQIEMQHWMLRRKMKNQILVDVQDVETTNAKLREAGYFDEKILTPSEICALLGVDAIITSKFALSKPLSEEAAIALGIILNSWGNTTNEILANLSIFDGKKEKIIWDYRHRIEGSVGSSTNQIVYHLMRNASKRMPYKQS